MTNLRDISQFEFEKRLKKDLGRDLNQYELGYLNQYLIKTTLSLNQIVDIFRSVEQGTLQIK